MPRNFPTHGKQCFNHFARFPLNNIANIFMDENNAAVKIRNHTAEQLSEMGTTLYLQLEK